jgi:hypothetical protein
MARKQYSKNGFVRFLDSLFSHQVGEPGLPFSYRSLPAWPVWLCGLVTGHRDELRWGDYNADVSGTRCRCGTVEKERD